MNRRSFLAVAAGATTLSIAGCTGLFDDSPPEELDDVEADTDQLPSPTIADGPVTIEVYEDLGCPSCHQFLDNEFPDIEAELLATDEATYQHVDFPLPADDRSVALANAARAVQAETGSDDDSNGDFFAYKSAILDDDWDDETLAAIAADEFDVDEDVVLDALDDGTYYPTLAADREQGTDTGVDSTPTVIVDGETVDAEADAIIEAVRDAS